MSLLCWVSEDGAREFKSGFDNHTTVEVSHAELSSLRSEASSTEPASIGTGPLLHGEQLQTLLAGGPLSREFPLVLDETNYHCVAMIQAFGS